jgi:hypothetical protein
LTVACDTTTNTTSRSPSIFMTIMHRHLKTFSPPALVLVLSSYLPARCRSKRFHLCLDAPHLKRHQTNFCPSTCIISNISPQDSSTMGCRRGLFFQDRTYHFPPYTALIHPHPTSIPPFFSYIYSPICYTPDEAKGALS